MTTALCSSLVEQDNALEDAAEPRVAPSFLLKPWRTCRFHEDFNIKPAEPNRVIKRSRMGFKYKSCLNINEKETVGGLRHVQELSRAETGRAAAARGLSKSVWRGGKKKKL